MHDEHWAALLLDTDRRHLVRAATRLLGPAEAEDAVQDAYIRALESDIGGLNAAQAWLLTVVRHLAIDKLRRRDWMQQWQAQSRSSDVPAAAPSAEAEAALASDVARALRLLAACLSPAEGAALLLHEVFEASHAEIAQASGKAEAATRQQVRRALQKLLLQRQQPAAGQAGAGPDGDLAPHEDTLFRVYLQSLQLRDAQALWAMLRQPPVRAVAHAGAGACAAATHATATPSTTCGLVQAGGQLGLVLTLDGVVLCVVPLGVHNDACEAQAGQAALL
ncbi:sigma-70 family RNA polymerase sigma factor [Acidovorax sp. sic0104]|uniref:sigma-70 family RNA polymerase sigma factor n=1 Tax=Acidovorax sp. sic0104 TaxID=2854784 RepID=UPI001C4752F1|nr:sigma-70 family RNA polymerase sigma factor [Acidovorax sp. sic0104]MBV7539669.1 sigma-70 family RNA polymerase sigma factor [Acidovorax sp. sic0104]